MGTTRLLDGRRDLRGLIYNAETIGGSQMKVGDYVSRRPLRWSCTCLTCGQVQTHDHARLLNDTARCVNANCGKAERFRELEETSTLAGFRRREREQVAERDRLREQRLQASLDEAKAEFERTTRELASVTRQQITTGQDDDFRPAPDNPTELPTYQVQQYNSDAALTFLQRHPEAVEVLSVPANAHAVQQYIERQGIRIISAGTYEAAYNRLAEYGLLEQPAQPAPVVAPAPSPSKGPASVQTSAEQPQEPSRVIGYDFQTGLQREFTPREVDRMSADEYRRTFRIVKADLAVPITGPGPLGRRA